ncbi:hypothetical protein EG329_012887 [Mollisiaceae sp. DMI_Dod_QoI]|nr:hypothetical protein EG329_012887 [Helotiales sp. DMI_Dod_QoI]
MKILLEEYDPAWAVEFARVRDHLFLILKDVSIRTIEHVGSTSVPGLIAKPVLDIDIIVSPQDLDAARAALVSAGYVDIGEYGVPGRWAFRQPGFVLNAKDGSQTMRDDTKETEMRRNVYVVLDGCVSLKNHLDLKRMLLEDAELRDEYGEVKKAIVARGVDSTLEYCKRKTEVLIKILKRAGWKEYELEEVRKANE